MPGVPVGNLPGRVEPGKFPLTVTLRAERAGDCIRGGRDEARSVTHLGNLCRPTFHPMTRDDLDDCSGPSGALWWPLLMLAVYAILGAVLWWLA